jgi:hypothetical protein
VIHPWFGGSQLNLNFAGSADHVAKTLAIGAFQSFVNNRTLVDGIPHAEAAKLLSGLVFLNGWPATGTNAPQSKPFCRVYLNGGAQHALEVSDFDPFTKAFGDGVVVERIDPPRPKTSGRGLVAGALLAIAAGALTYHLAVWR